MSKPDRPGGAALLRVVVDIRDFHIVDVKAVFRGVPAPHHQPVDLVVDLGDTGQHGEDPAHIARRARSPADLLVGETDRTDRLLCGLAEFAALDGQAFQFDDFHSQPGQDDTRAPGPYHHIRYQSGFVAGVADLEELVAELNALKGEFPEAVRDRAQAGADNQHVRSRERRCGLGISHRAGDRARFLFPALRRRRILAPGGNRPVHDCQKGD